MLLGAGDVYVDVNRPRPDGHRLIAVRAFDAPPLDLYAEVEATQITQHCATVIGMDTLWLTAPITRAEPRRCHRIASHRCFGAP